MEARKLSPVQIDLLKLFQFDHSDEFAIELRGVINQYLQKKIDEETDHLWDEGILDQKAIDQIKDEDLHILLRKNESARH